MFLVDLVVDRQFTNTGLSGLLVSGLCACIQVIGLEFDPGHKSVLSHSFFLFRHVLVEHLRCNCPYINY